LFPPQHAPACGDGLNPDSRTFDFRKPAIAPHRPLEMLIRCWVMVPFGVTGTYLVFVGEYRGAALFSEVPALLILGIWRLTAQE